MTNDAVAFAQIPNLSPLEWTFAAKRQVLAACAASVTTSPVNWQAFVTQGVSRFGEDLRARFTHSVARALIAGKRPDLARPLLTSAIANLPSSVPQWGRAAWSLAKLEADANNFEVAANLYFLVGQNVMLRQELEQAG